MISNPKDYGDAMNDEAKTSEENHKGDFVGKRDSGRERREWTSERTKGTCVICCGRIPFWNLAVGVVGLSVILIWGGS